MRTLIAIVIVSLVATSTAFARKASHHHFKRAAPKHQSATKTDPGGIAANRGTTLSISRKNRVLRAPRNHRCLRCRRRRSGRVAFRVLSAMKRSHCHNVSRERAASHDLAILLATAMRRRIEANPPAPLVLVALRCCRRGCRRNGSAKSLH